MEESVSNADYKATLQETSGSIGEWHPFQQTSQDTFVVSVFPWSWKAGMGVGDEEVGDEAREIFAQPGSGIFEVKLSQ